jgi:hypothetical protein
MAIVTCPNCHRRYDPGVDDLQQDMPDNLSLKVVCPACGQWLRLPEREAIDPPDVPPDLLREMSAQSRLVDEEEAPSERRRRDDEERPSRRGSRDRDYEDEDRPRRRWRDDNSEDDEYEDRPRRRSYDDERDDFDDYPRRKPTDGLGITSMVLGIMSCVLALPGVCCGVFSLLSILGGIIAVILGFVARSQTRVASGPAKTGIITGFIAIVLAMLLFVAMIALQFGGGIGN